MQKARFAGIRLFLTSDGGHGLDKPSLDVGDCRKRQNTVNAVSLLGITPVESVEFFAETSDYCFIYFRFLGFPVLALKQRESI